jgi:hypothetical protein
MGRLRGGKGDGALPRLVSGRARCCGDPSHNMLSIGSAFDRLNHLRLGVCVFSRRGVSVFICAAAVTHRGDGIILYGGRGEVYMGRTKFGGEFKSKFATNSESVYSRDAD